MHHKEPKLGLNFQCSNRCHQLNIIIIQLIINLITRRLIIILNIIMGQPHTVGIDWGLIVDNFHECTAKVNVVYKRCG